MQRHGNANLMSREARKASSTTTKPANVKSPRQTAQCPPTSYPHQTPSQTTARSQSPTPSSPSPHPTHHQSSSPTQSRTPHTHPFHRSSSSANPPSRRSGKQVLNLLCQVPKGGFTTYAAMSAHIGSASHKTCARAVGNAMRNNPFAPVVPCHRVLAADGRIGGFGGDWGEEGKHAAVKKRMLREEGVKFDGLGKVVGKAFTGFEGDGKN